MRRFVAALVACLCFIPLAKAGPYTDDLSKCLVASTTADDQIVFMRWMFAILSLHPAVGNMVSITSEERAAINKKTVGLFVRLMSVDCRQQTIAAIKYEGPAATLSSFQLFGQVAMRGLMGNAKVAQGMKALGAEFAEDQNWISLMREVELPVAAPGK